MKHFAASLALAILCAAAAPAALANTFNPVTQFSTANNGGPNNVWGYGYGTPESSYAADPLSGSNYRNGATDWNYWEYAATPNDLPVVAENPNPGTDCSYSSICFPSNVLLMHPGDSTSTASILQFTAPAAGTYTLSGFFERIDTTNAGTGATVSIDEDNGGAYTYLLSPTLLNPSSHVPDNFSYTVTLSTGEMLDFDVAEDGSYDNDSTGLNLQVSQTPEPSSLLLLGSGLAAVAGFARRRFRA